MPRLPHSQSQGSSPALIDRLGLNEIPSELPSGLELYARTPDFTRETLPAELRSAYATEEGVWGLIRVLQGTVSYRLKEPFTAEVQATAGETIVIEPQHLHCIRFVTPGRFFIELHLLRSDIHGSRQATRPQ